MYFMMLHKIGCSIQTNSEELLCSFSPLSVEAVQYNNTLETVLYENDQI